MTVTTAELRRRRSEVVRAPTKAVLRQWGVATAGLRPLPDFLIIGTKRGGTTSLFNYLLMHPLMVPMFPARRLKSPAYFFEHYDRGERWYRSHFPTAPYRQFVHRVRRAATVTGEASPYYLYHPHTPTRVHALVPEVKLIVLLRNPVRRAYSHYWERVDNGVESLSFEAALAAEPKRLAGETERMLADPTYYSRAHDWYSYRDRGIYEPQVRRWFDVFPRSQFLILRSEDMYANEQAVFDAVTTFLEIPRFTLPARPRHNYRPAEEMSTALRDELAAFYRPHNERLYDVIGRDMQW